MGRIRALHVFPIFSHEALGGSDVYELMLSRTLVERGVDVDVFATRAARFRMTSSVSLDWRNELPSGHETVHGIDVHRFPATWSVPTRLARFVSGFVERRWAHEESLDDPNWEHPDGAMQRYMSRAEARPTIYDWVHLLGVGPWPVSMLSAIRRNIASYDVILVGFVPFALVWSVTRLARRLEKPVAVLALFHPEDRFHHHRPFYRAFRMADAVLCQTSYTAGLIGRSFSGARVHEVGCGTDMIHGADRTHGSGFRARHGFGDRPLVLLVGRKEPGKRYDMAIQAMERLANTQARLAIIGDDSDRKPITSSRAVHLGRVSDQDLREAFAACDVFLLPSEHESFGIVFLEAWAHRKPVIGNSRCRPVSSVIEEGVDGFLCSTPDEIAARLTALIADPALRRRLGEAGYRKVVDRYTWDAVAGRVESIYDTLVAAGPRRDR